eukprot:631985-Amphidinium_carterae.2
MPATAMPGYTAMPATAMPGYTAMPTTAMPIGTMTDVGPFASCPLGATRSTKLSETLQQYYSSVHHSIHVSHVPSFRVNMHESWIEIAGRIRGRCQFFTKCS